MESSSLPTHFYLSHPRTLLGSVALDWMPQPGTCVEYADKTYMVLERRHHYALKLGRYHLSRISLYVKLSPRPTERSLVGDRWVLGEANCRFNAQSELIRCAVNPQGPCAGCRHFEREALSQL
ncbi:DUF6464 family protein [Leptolyngbya sp. FACHB-261]|uniref:DUF6464 family protein n=1 Tax=Leptolyngbya sp. FACHB-261 TaxID=2692806 RepID=UPI0016834DE7|nr:DUF6464 family protein [Leptolyngbya sp. FACHB-261]MBD2105011.1 hypothetical protein [Leptolyngbya sp. FACHB-261]